MKQKNNEFENKEKEENKENNEKRAKKEKYSEKRRFGNRGEDIVNMLLVKRGHEIICRNFLRKVGEIDIISEKDKIIHLIEVKSVTHETSIDVNHETQDVYRPEDLINNQKKLHMKRTIELFIMENNLDNFNLQIDLAIVYFYKSGEVPRIQLIENIII